MLPLGVVYTFNNMIEIESSVTAFSAYMTFHSGNTELCDKITFEIDNSRILRQYQAPILFSTLNLEVILRQILEQSSMLLQVRWSQLNSKVLVL